LIVTSVARQSRAGLFFTEIASSLRRLQRPFRGIAEMPERRVVTIYIDEKSPYA
jgi:hypothetical protein